MAGFGRRGSPASRRRRTPEPPDLDGTDGDGRPRDARADPLAAPPSDPVSAAHTVCLNLLTARARTRSELAGALADRGFDDDVAVTVLDRLSDVRLVDDAAFAEQWVDSRHRHRGLGRRALADELRRKGVDNETAGVALAELGRDDEQVKARELVERRLPSLARFDDDVATRRLVGMLARKGYDAGVAYGAVREAMAARGAEPDDALDLSDD